MRVIQCRDCPFPGYNIWLGAQDILFLVFQDLMKYQSSRQLPSDPTIKRVKYQSKFCQWSGYLRALAFPNTTCRPVFIGAGSDDICYALQTTKKVIINFEIHWCALWDRSRNLRCLSFCVNLLTELYYCRRIIVIVFFFCKHYVLITVTHAYYNILRTWYLMPFYT